MTRPNDANTPSATAPAALLGGQTTYAVSEAKQALSLITASLDDSKAEDTQIIDLSGKSPLFDQIVVTSGRSHRHVNAVADHLLRALKDGGFGKASVEGLPACDWVLVDAGDVVVHIFRPEVRTFYNLERMWRDQANQTDGTRADT